LITTLLDNPEDKSLVKEVAQKVQKFYFGNKPITYSPDSGIVDVSVFGIHSRTTYPGYRTDGLMCIVLCGCQICSHQHGLVFEDKVLR
jgi:hypothetical protein